MGACQLPSQRYAAVGIINPQDSDDCLVSVFAAFDVEQDAVRYVEDTLSDVHRTFDLFVVSTNSWIFPDVLRTEAADRVPSSYRHEHLHDIMDYKKQLPARIEAYEEQCRSLGMQPKYTDVTGNAEDASVPTTEYGVPPAEEEIGALTDAPHIAIVDEPEAAGVEKEESPDDE